MNDDTISRAAAFDSVEIFLKQTDAPEVYPGLIPALARVINNVPSAQQVRTQMSSADDLISRTQAIDALDEQIKFCDNELCDFNISLKDEYAVKVERASLCAYKEILEDLPSAQPESIKCKDCRHGVDYYHEGDCYCSNPKWGLMYFGGSWEFYCADAERREG